jgi:hypothetical protein
MRVRAEVFISATSADLGSYRKVAKEAVLMLGAHPSFEHAQTLKLHERFWQ